MRALRWFLFALLLGSGSAHAALHGTAQPGVASSITPGTDLSSGAATATGGDASRTLAARFADRINVLNYTGVDNTGVSDSSSAVQTILNSMCGKNVYFPAGTYLVKGLVLPNCSAAEGTISGDGRGVTILKLPNGANTYLLASYGYVNNTTSSDWPIWIRDLDIDGNGSNQSGTSALVILRTFGSMLMNLSVYSSAGHALLFTSLSANSTNISGNMGSNRVYNSIISNNAGSGLYGRNSGSALADMLISGNIFSANGTSATNTCNVDVERAAGFKFIGNDVFNSDICEFNFNNAAGNEIVGNRFDGSTNTASSGNVNTVSLTSSGFGNVTITGNTFRTSAASLPAGASGWVLLHAVHNAGAGINATGNNFYSGNIAVTSIDYSGTVSSTNHLVAYPNKFSTLSPAPTDSNIDLPGLDSSLIDRGFVTESVTGSTNLTNSFTGENGVSLAYGRYATDATAVAYNTNRGRGTIASPTDVVNSDQIAFYQWKGYVSGALRNACSQTISVNAAPGGAWVPGKFSISCAENTAGSSVNLLALSGQDAQFPAGRLKLTEVAAPSGAAGFDLIYADSTAHRIKGNMNSGGATTFALFSDNLSVFASTTSAQLAGVLSDETGSGAAVFGTSPTIATPTLTGTIVYDNATTATATAGAATCNAQKCVITSESLTTAAGAYYTLTLTNSVVATTKIVLCSVDNGTNTTDELVLSRVTAGSGTATIKVKNTAVATALNGTIKISCVVR